MGSHKKQRKRSTSTSEDSEGDVKEKKVCRSRSPIKKKKRRLKKREESSSSSDSSSTASSSSSSKCTSSSSSSSSSDFEETRERLKKQKKLKKKAIDAKKEEKEEGASADIPLDLMNKAKAMAPMTKEEWEKRQNVVRRVYDESTGRHRLIKGDGEVIEEIVSQDRHKAINQQATKGDGDFFQSRLANSLKK